MQLRSMEYLEWPFRTTLEHVFEARVQRNITYRPFFTRRSPWEQARFWRQSRSYADVAEGIKYLNARKQEWLADIISAVGPQYGRWATNAMPGYSWHQWGFACDVYAFDTKANKVLWDAKPYYPFARLARHYGLTAGYFWKSQDAVHVQLHAHEVHEHFMSKEMESILTTYFGETEAEWLESLDANT